VNTLAEIPPTPTTTPTPTPTTPGGGGGGGDPGTGLADTGSTAPPSWFLLGMAALVVAGADVVGADALRNARRGKRR
jgi:hypothetical protein